MIESGIKPSVLVPFQLPEHIRDDPDYQNFVSFIQAYYEWMEQENNLVDRSKNLLNYNDIDKTTDQFIQYYINDFLPNFPSEVLVDKRRLVKLARELYHSKGTPASFQFLFRVLYNSDFDVYYTKDAVLKASDGSWYVPKSVKLLTSDINFLKIKNYRLFGETSKSIATVDNIVLAGSKTEVFISNIERLFQSGEFVKVVDNKNQDIYFLDGEIVSPDTSGAEILRAKILGTLSQIKVDPNNRGSLYKHGDPVVVYGGLTSNTGIGATAYVDETTTGSIQKINVLSGGIGYRVDPDTIISITNSGGATAKVSTLNPDINLKANVSFLPVNVVNRSKNNKINSTYAFLDANPAANANTKLINALSFISFDTYPISSVLVTNGGGGISKPPTASAESVYLSEYDQNVNLSYIGILGGINIIDGGHDYQVNDTITFTGGNGYGAYANVTAVSVATGAITEVSFVYGPGIYPLGGMGYTNGKLPTLSVNSSNPLAGGAILSVVGVLGTGAEFSILTDRVGSVTTIKLSNYGEDYATTPNVSLKVEDILVANVQIMNLPQKGDLIYQGVSLNNYSYKATVDSISLLSADNDPSKSVYNLRVFNYSSLPDTNKMMKIDEKNINLAMANVSYNSFYNPNVAPDGPAEKIGIRLFGSEIAKATASYLNGLVLGDGQYLNDRGQLSSFNVLQNEYYNNFTYEITVEKEIAKYKDTLLSLLHPGGMNILGRYRLSSNSNFMTDTQSAVRTGKPLIGYTNYPATSATMYADFNTKSTNIVQISNLGGGQVEAIILPGDIIEIKPTNGPYVSGVVESVNYLTTNTVTLTSNTWLTYSNVAYVATHSGSNVININSLTNSYDIINNGRYSNTQYPLKDIVYAGDKIRLESHGDNLFIEDGVTPLLTEDGSPLTTEIPVYTVTSVDYVNGNIYINSNVSKTYTNISMSVNRTFVPTSCVIIYGPLGTEYVPELVTEQGVTLTTEDNRIILLG